MDRGLEKAAVACLRAGSRAELEARLRDAPELARRPRLVVEAARLARADALERLLAAGADPDARHRGYRPLHALLQEEPHVQAEAGAERLRCLDLLLAAGARPAELAAFPPMDALLVAAWTGEDAFVERLLGAGAEVNLQGAAALGRRDEVERALSADPARARERGPGGWTALQACCASRLSRADPAVRVRRLSIAALLLDAGADPAARLKGWSEEVDVAHLAIGALDRELVELLLARGADATAALPAALGKGSDELAALALAHGADVNAARAGGRPVLHEMIRWGRVEQALWLLARGAAPDARGPEGWTALHQAVSRGNERLVRALLLAGASRTAVDDAGLTPLELARDRHRTKLERLLTS